MKQNPAVSSKVLLTWLGVALLSAPVLLMLASDPKPGLFTGIAVALGSALVVLGNIRA